LVLVRSLVYFVALVLSILVFGLILALLGWFLPPAWKEPIGNAWGDVNMWALRLICGLRHRVTGAANLPRQPVIVMAKHQSAWETIALRSILRGHQAWVLKRELMWIPFFGWAMVVMNPIAIDRKAGRKAVRQVVSQGTKALEDGRYVVIFPEGTRTAPGTRGRYGIGGALLAEHSGYPVIPIAHNAGVFWRRRGFLKLPGTIEVVIGEPIPTVGRKASAIIRDVESWIEGEVARLPGCAPLEGRPAA
jgi:1-acyl-sn-glycerol-3-phosphate acyltransferase